MEGNPGSIVLPARIGKRAINLDVLSAARWLAAD
jgi:hypothetical protein